MESDYVCFPLTFLVFPQELFRVDGFKFYCLYEIIPPICIQTFTFALQPSLCSPILVAWCWYPTNIYDGVLSHIYISTLTVSGDPLLMGGGLKGRTFPWGWLYALPFLRKCTVLGCSLLITVSSACSASRRSTTFFF